MPNVGLPELLILAATIGLMVLIPAAVIILVVRALRGDGTAPTPPDDPAMDTARARFASGEIDEAEFERLRSALQRH
jgi:uncharacterized membrane protein